MTDHDRANRWDDSGMTRKDLLENMRQSLLDAVGSVRLEIKNASLENRQYMADKFFSEIMKDRAERSSLLLDWSEWRTMVDARHLGADKREDRRWKLMVGLMATSFGTLLTLVLHMLKII